jgi:two-component system NarL family response regulator
VTSAEKEMNIQADESSVFATQKDPELTERRIPGDPQQRTGFRGVPGGDLNALLPPLPKPQPDISGEQMTDLPRTIKVLIADDHPVVRQGLATLINQRSDMKVVAQAGSGQDAKDQFLASRPDVTLLDLRMPMGDGIQAISAIREKEPGAKLVILTSYQDEEDIYQALQAGALGYLLKSAPSEEIIECIRVVSSGRTWIPPGVGAKLATRVSAQELTRREAEVLQAMAEGKSNREIGVTLKISEGTVKVHMTHILEKLKASGRTEAIGVAAKKGLIRLDNSPAL